MIGAEYMFLTGLAEFVCVVRGVGHGCGCMHDVDMHSQRRTLHDWSPLKKFRQYTAISSAGMEFSLRCCLDWTGLEYPHIRDFTRLKTQPWE